MFSSLIFKQEESPVTKKKYYPTPISTCGRTQNSRESMAANTAENTGDAKQSSHHRERGHSLTPGAGLFGGGREKAYLFFEQGAHTHSSTDGMCV